MRLTGFLILLVIFSNAAMAIRINEIMYAPTNAWGGAYNEWLELYNEGSSTVDLSSWKIEGNNFDDFNLSAGGYVVVARDLSDFRSYYGSDILAVDGSFSLNNDGDTINLSNGTESWVTNYTDEKAKGNNKTLEWTGSGWEESLVDGGTPGQENSKHGFSQDYAAIKISEFLPDAFGSDEADKPLGEWVELYNPTDSPMDLRGLVLYDEDDDHELGIADTTTTSTVIQPKSYLVIYRNDDNDFALNNDGYEEVRLYDDYPVNISNLIDLVSYSGSMEGMSWSKIEENWYKTPATPGSANARVDGCDWQVKIVPQETIVNSGSSVEFNVVLERQYGEADNLTVEGRIEDLFGQIMETYKPWTNEAVTTTRTKTYSPNLGQGVYKIIFEIKGMNCQDQALNNNLDAEIMAVSPKYKVFDSSLAIQEIYLGNDDQAKWGDRINVKVNIYKGDNTKYNVELYAEKNDRTVSKRTKTSAFDKFTNYTLTLPVQLEPNCGGDYADGDYEIVLAGLDKEVRKTIEIEGIDEELCQEMAGTTAENKNFGYRILEKPDKIKTGEDFIVQVELNGDEKEHDLKIKGYVYRGPKHYSKEVLKEVKLETNEIKIVELKMEVNESVAAGDYKLKIKINKDNQKTDKELTEEIKVEGAVDEQQCVVVGESLAVKQEVSVSEKLSLLKKLNEEGKMVYLSSSKKGLKWLPAMIMVVLVLLCLLLVFKKV